LKTIIETQKKIKPFLRWAGGKNWFTKHIESFLPIEFNDYYEPFLGGGSIFFYLKSKGLINRNAFLSDSNEDLINTYKVIRDNLTSLILILKTQKDSEEEYYKIRSTKFDDPIEQAGKFLFLNKTSFNGIYRVNRLGEYNVPYGKRNLKDLYDYEHLTQISELLKNTILLSDDFKVICNEIKKNDLVFVDPPYTVAHENNGFIQYNQSIFSWEDQIELARIITKYEKSSVNYIVTNASHKSIEKLYKNSKIKTLSRSSTIGGRGAKRTNYNEIVITNNK